MKIFETFILFISWLSIIYGHEKIKLTDIQVLTLNSGYFTNGRRSKSVPQLECVGGSSKCEEHLLPKVVQCQNMGTDGYDVQWKCQAEMHTNLKFGKIDVNCEGFDYPNDKYVLKGSCGLRYTLEISTKQGSKSDSWNDNSSKKPDESSNNKLYFVVFCIALCALVYYFYQSSGYSQSTGQQPYTDGPPAPGFRSEYMPPPPYESVNRNKYHGTGTNDGPGFWTGLGAGGLMGYLFGSSNNTRQTPYCQPTNTYYQPQSTWFDRDDSHTTHRSNDSDDSHDVRTSSGYGGTSRR